MGKKVWKTKDGKEIPIKDMTDSHIVNCVRLLSRAFNRYRLDMFDSPPSLNGEIAQECADREWLWAVTEMTAKDLFPIIEDLMEEVRHRKAMKGII